MNGFDAILHNIAVLALAMAVGFAAVKTGYISNEVKNALSKIIVKITLPILVMTSLTKVTLDSTRLVNSAIVLAVTILAVGAMYFIGNRTAHLFKLDKSKIPVHEGMTALGNVVFLGYPLIGALFGDEGIFYAALYAMGNDAFVWTLSVYRLSQIKNSEKKSLAQNLKNLINPATIAFFISFVMMIFKLKFTGIIGEVMTGIGSTTTYLSMLFIGGTLACVDIRHIYRRVSIFVLTVLKMLVFPSALIFVLHFMPINPIVASVIILQAAMPSQTLMAVLSTEYGGDVQYAAEGIFITTIASLATLPIVYILMNLAGLV